ncbi:unnamed protein product [Trichogramma brassicae]|uniref:Uncharacterized protein n=1 Tax=Trichogramma brassicae TaxID=86971 RepID=A0A6H5IRZ4_9HYME|nr:unnamed protein product [Trichogramma brassicae]
MSASPSSTNDRDHPRRPAEITFADQPRSLSPTSRDHFCRPAEITLAHQPRSLSPTSRDHSRRPAETAPLRGHPPTHSPLNERRRRR